MTRIDALTYDALTLANLLHGVNTLIEDMPMHHEERHRNKDLSAGLAVLVVAKAAADKLLVDLVAFSRTPGARDAA